MSVGKFRYDINFLRAIAVLSVLFYHFKIPFFDGGFAGVDIFFVISGYLMSKIIITGIENGTFSILDFYAKRVKRIIPALLAMIFLITIVGFFCFLPKDYSRCERISFYSIIFYSNILFTSLHGYFDPTSDSNIMLHTWSLSVEWQFYLVYPIILVLVNKLVNKKSLFIKLFIITTLLQFGATIYLTNKFPIVSFFSLHTRAWEMMFGGIALLLEPKIKISKIFVYISYLALILSVLLFDKNLTWPGLYTFIPVFATFLIILANKSDIIFLKGKVIQQIGKISYSLYLWHWPLLITVLYFGIQLNVLSSLLLIAGSICMGTISFYSIESIHFKKSYPILLVSIFLAGSTFFISTKNINKILFKKETLQIESYNQNHLKEQDIQFGTGTCFLSAPRLDSDTLHTNSCLCIDTTKQNILLLGDSHGAELSMSFRERFEKQNINLIQATSSGCSPFINSKGIPKCQDLFNFIYNNYFIKNSNKINGIIFCGNWYLFSENDKKQLISSFNNTLSYFKKFNIPFVIIGQTEVYILDYSTIAAKEFQYNINVSSKYFSKESRETNELLSKEFPQYYINIYDSLIPKISDKNIPYMFDGNHYTKFGADLAVNKILASPVFNNQLHLKITK